jgi:hypothetical protein
MAYRYLIYRTDVTYLGTITRESAINNPGVNEASLHSNFLNPKVQPLYLWRVVGSTVIPNTDANIAAWTAHLVPPTQYLTGATNGLGLSGKRVCLGGQILNNTSIDLATHKLIFVGGTVVSSGATSSFDSYNDYKISGSTVLCIPRSNFACGNLAIGYQALTGTTSGNNLAIGYQALNKTLGGNGNIGIGYQPLYSNTAGAQNIAIGICPLYCNTGGAFNVAIGYGSMRLNTTGCNNNAQGYYALRGNTTGSFNTTQGSFTMYLGATGSFNTAQGSRALYSNSTGSGNTGIGMCAGYRVTTGGYNTFLGYDAGYNASQKVDAQNSMALGNGAYTTADNQIVIGNTSITQTLLRGTVLYAGTNTIAPLKFTSGVSLASPVAGAIEFTTDDYFATITTGTARKGFVLDDGARLTSGKIPIASTNGRLIDGQTPLVGTKIYYVSDTNGGATTRKLTFTNGILTSET